MQEFYQMRPFCLVIEHQLVIWLLPNNEMFLQIKDCQSIIPNQETTTEFLYYLLKNNVQIYLKSQGEGTTFGELSKRTLREPVFAFQN